eukprot:CAMPEP_0183742890 /NCGR_PEP_ID=MMETSP0737-20130205/64933_1 /TAXON_ID=385413 /ORGANISM="Thalassiosira miniscula, Strain CCMP1093" /LENGTH=188 /DNA_ID=CAMNT_0025978485 /DNA_START=34 /DNA_END=601 /DNA_ORIENTATION=+
MTIPQSPEEDLNSWFLAKELQWTTSIQKSLDDLGVDSVQDVKMMKPEEWKALFADEKLIQQRKAEQAYKDLCGEIAAAAIPVFAVTAVSATEHQAKPIPSAPAAESVLAQPSPSPLVSTPPPVPAQSASAPVANAMTDRSAATPGKTTEDDNSKDTDRDNMMIAAIVVGFAASAAMHVDNVAVVWRTQ